MTDKHLKSLCAGLLMLLCTMPSGMKAQSLSTDTTSQAATDTICHEVLFHTTMGDIRIRLFNETPIHRDNFLKLVREGYYDGNLFHRVIADFMIQTGDSTSRHSEPGVVYGEHDAGYTLPAEICYPKLFHRRGMVGAAREGDDVNPERRSSGSQFYIVYGTVMSSMALERMQEQLSRQTNGKVKLTREVRNAYRMYGGSPHLDGQYTIFGEVTDGMNTVRKINYVKTDEDDRPYDDVRIIKAEIVK